MFSMVSVTVLALLEVYNTLGRKQVIPGETGEGQRRLRGEGGKWRLEGGNPCWRGLGSRTLDPFIWTAADRRALRWRPQPGSALGSLLSPAGEPADTHRHSHDSSPDASQ